MPARATCEDDVHAVLPLAQMADALALLATEGTHRAASDTERVRR
jgi:hypothetical protein